MAFCLKIKTSFNFLKKLFTYGSGTYMIDFNEQQRVENSG